jgi:hypothetical protein
MKTIKFFIKKIIKEELEYTTDDAIQDIRKIKQIIEQEQNWSFRQIGPRQFHFTYTSENSKPIIFSCYLEFDNQFKPKTPNPWSVSELVEMGKRKPYKILKKYTTNDLINNFEKFKLNSQ